MPDVFGLDVRSLVANAIRDAGNLRPGTLIKSTPTVDDANPTAATTPTETRHNFTGFVYRARDERRPGTLIPDTRRTLLIIGGSVSPLVAPAINDTVEIDGQTLTLEQETSGDSTGAAFEFRVK